MDTSDSEHFESADEDIHSDDDESFKNVEKDFVLNKQETSCTEKAENIEDVKLLTENTLVNETEKIKIEEGTENILNKNKDSKNLENESKVIRCEVEVKPNLNKQEPVTKIKSKPQPELATKITSKSSRTEKPVEKIEVNDEERHGHSNLIQKEPISKSKLEETEGEENLWQDDELDWEVENKLENEIKTTLKQKAPMELESIEHKLPRQQDTWGGWGNWGASVLSSATQSVTSITSQLTNVIETGLGAIDPEELAKIDREEKKNEIQTEKQETGFGLGNLVKLVENTGSKVISGGLDTLETIGKKTMEVLQEGDPGLKKKRAFLKIDQNKPVLSQILREAKEKAEKEAKETVNKKKVKNYETLFDDHHGLLHLEALEFLSKQCEYKLKNIQNSEQNSEFIETMDQIKELCDLPDEDDEDERVSVDEIKEKLNKAVKEINVPINYEKLITSWEETDIWLETINLEICDEEELHQQAIETLAEVTSMAMECFHKISELLLIKERRSTADEADSLVQITTTLISLISIVAEKFSEKLNQKKSRNELITNVFFEAANSGTYIKDALQLIIPVLQVGAI